MQECWYKYREWHNSVHIGVVVVKVFIVWFNWSAMIWQKTVEMPHFILLTIFIILEASVHILHFWCSSRKITSAPNTNLCITLRNILLCLHLLINSYGSSSVGRIFLSVKFANRNFEHMKISAFLQWIPIRKQEGDNG